MSDGEIVMEAIEQVGIFLKRVPYNFGMIRKLLLKLFNKKLL